MSWIGWTACIVGWLICTFLNGWAAIYYEDGPGLRDGTIIGVAGFFFAPIVVLGVAVAMAYLVGQSLIRRYSQPSELRELEMIHKANLARIRYKEIERAVAKEAGIEIV